MRDWSSEKPPITGRALEICGVYLCAALAVSLLFAETGHALTINNLLPESFETIEKVLGIGDSLGDGTIPKDLEEAQCGGFDYEVTVADKIPKVKGLPGRDGDYFGNITSGMAVRNDDGFIAPGDVEVCGYRTACRPDDPEYMSGDTSPRYFPPFFDTFPCQRPLGDATPDKPPVPTGRNGEKFPFTCGGATMPADGHVCDAGYDSSEALNGGLCGWLNNRWLYGYYQKKVPVDYACNDNRDPNGDGSQLIGKTLCWVTLYSENSKCREVSKEDAALGFNERVSKRDELNNSQPDDPGLNGGQYKLDWEAERQCCTYQNTNGRIYGPDGTYDTSGDESSTNNLLKNCIPCEGNDCKYMPGVSPKPRWQYYPPWAIEVDKRGQCFYCVNIEDSTEEVSCDAANASEPIYPCEHLVSYKLESGLTYSTRERGQKRYRSYFRHYTGSYSRAKVPFTDYEGEKHLNEEPKKYVMDDSSKSKIPVSCYRMYKEADYKTQVAKPNQKACVIAAYYGEPNRNFWEMGRRATKERGPNPKKIRGTQEGKGEYNSEFQDIPALIRDTTFDEEKDLWYPGIGNAFSLTNGKVMEERYNNDLTMVLLQPADSAHLESSIQLYYTAEDEEDPKKQKVALSSGALMRAFDDTVHNNEGGSYYSSAWYPDQRTIAEWWQRQETMANLLFKPPAIHLFLPPAWSVGLDPLDPLFTPEIIEHPNLSEDPRMQVLDVQLEANEDLIDVVKAFLQRTLTPQLEEELIPILVPLGSPTEFRALAERWHGWAIAQEERGGSGGDDAIELAAKLEQYARHIEEVRKLRGELVWFHTKLLEHQTFITETIGAWLNEDVTAKYDGFRDLYAQLEPLRETWQQTQSTYRKMHDKSSMPWCHNERFTVPIYSLLDEWMSSRPDLTGGKWRKAQNSMGDLPSLAVPRMIDGVFDFTALRAASGSLEVPVLDPIQVRLAMEVVKPPTIYEEDVNVPTLPDLPPIPSVRKIIENYETASRKIYPDISVGVPPPSIEFEIWSESEVNAFHDILNAISTVITGMEEEYRLFWDSQNKFDYDNPPKPLTELDCYGRHSDTCVHTEWDLLERLMRFGTRPAVLLLEDFLSIGSFRENPAEVGYGIESCPDRDWACQLLHGSETHSYEGWDVNWKEGEMLELEGSLCPQAQGTLADQMRFCMFQETLVNTSGEDAYPYAVEREKIIPSFQIPDDTRIKHEAEQFEEP